MNQPVIHGEVLELPWSQCLQVPTFRDRADVQEQPGSLRARPTPSQEAEKPVSWRGMGTSTRAVSGPRPHAGFQENQEHGWCHMTTLQVSHSVTPRPRLARTKGDPGHDSSLAEQSQTSKEPKKTALPLRWEQGCAQATKPATPPSARARARASLK